jgi:hypothetical protein
MFQSFIERALVATLLVGLVAVFMLLICVDPGYAQVVAAPAAAPNVVQVQPFLHDLLMVAGIVVLVLLPLIIKPLADAATKNFHLASAAKVSDVLTKLAYDAVHFGINYCDAQIRTVRGIDVGDPKLAAAANWLLTHASDEIAHLNLTDQEVIGTVKAVFPQVKFSPPPAAS